MAQFEVLALDKTNSRARAPGSGDSYLMPRSLAVGGETVTVSAPVLDLSQSWNASGVTFTGIKFNVASDVSASGSLLMDLQVSGASKLLIRKDGRIFGRDTVSGNILIGGASGAAANSVILFGIGSSWSLEAFSSVSVNINSGLPLGWATGLYTTPDLTLYRDLANTLAQRNGANGQTFRLYGNYSTASDFRRLKMAMSLAGVAEIKPEDGGTYAGSTVLYISGLPTSNPGPGILWNNAGVVNVGT